MEIVEGIHQVDGVNANVYLVIEGEELMVIDTGMPNNAEKILRYVNKMNWQSSKISTILLTHCHIDHVGSAYQLRKLTDAKVAVHQEDADYVAGEENPARSQRRHWASIQGVFKLRQVHTSSTRHNAERER